MATKTELIMARLTPCNCGCQGADPWHRATYRRVVDEVQAVDETHQQGTVRLPFSTCPVRVTREGFFSEKCGRVLWQLWVVDRKSIVFDK